MENAKAINCILPQQPVSPTAPLKQSEALQSRFARAMLSSGSNDDGKSVPEPASRRSAAALTGQANTDGYKQAERRHAELPIHPSLSAPWLPVAMTSAPSSTPATNDANELPTLLDRLCSAMYVSEKSVSKLCVVLALDHVIPGAAAEVVLEGAHLIVRLRGRTEQAYQLMSSQREALLRTLGGDGGKHVEVVVLRNEAEHHDG